MSTDEVTTQSRKPFDQGGPRYWWLYAKFKASCSLCSRRLPRGQRVIYDALEKTVICPTCARESGVLREAGYTKPILAVDARRRARRQKKAERTQTQKDPMPDDPADQFDQRFGL